MPANPVVVAVTATDEFWYLDEDYINSLDENDIGTKQTIKVNGINHTVRLIGIDHDDEVDEAGQVIGKVHTTWEFANLLSDHEGYSLATVWDWEGGGPLYTNANYHNSNLRKAFDGKDNGELVWYRKGQKTANKHKELIMLIKPSMICFHINYVMQLKKLKTYCNNPFLYSQFI